MERGLGNSFTSLPWPIPYGWPPFLSQRAPWLTTSQEVGRLGSQLSSQVNFERAKALGCWELAPSPSGLASRLAPTPGNVHGTCWASRGGSAGTCVRATHPQVVAPGPSSSGKLGQCQYLQQGVRPETFLAEGASRGQSDPMKPTH